MGYIKNSSKEIGDWLTTTREHCSMAGKFTKGSRVRIIGVDSIRGYNIEDDEGNTMYEIGWII